MTAIIPDTDTDARLTGLEQILQRYLGPRQPEFGTSEAELQSITMPMPLERFFRFAGRWPGQNPKTPYANRFCMQDTLCAIRPNLYAPTLELMDSRLLFVWENQGVWVAATDPAGADPPVWISEDCSHRTAIRTWRRLDKPLSHFLVSFVLQELMFGSDIVGVAPGALARLEAAGAATRPVWVDGEYAWDIAHPSYFLADGSILIRHGPAEADGDDWYACNSDDGRAILKSLALPTKL